MALGLCAALAPVLAPYDPRANSGAALQAPSPHHLVGTNDAGQDILSQLIWGARSAAVVAVLAAAALVGVAVGLGGGPLPGSEG